jgi:hypothetical protein
MNEQLSRTTLTSLEHADIGQFLNLNVTDDELRRGLEVSWKMEGRPLRLAAAGSDQAHP